MRTSLALSVALLLALETVAYAEPTPQEKATAESLFREARAAMTGGQTAAACSKFDASNKLDPQLGTLLNLAVCHEKEGKIASAWAELIEVAERAERANDKERATFARKRIKELEPKLPRVRIKVEGGTPEMSVKVGGRTLTAAELSSAIPIDPGDIAIEATAPGKTSFTKTMNVPAGETTELVVPALTDAAAPEPAAPTGGAAIVTSPPANGSSTLRTVSFVLMGVGVVGVGVGAYFGVQTLSTKSDADAACPLPGQCTQQGLDLDEDAKKSALFSTIGFAAGGVALATGVVLFLTSRSSRSGSGALVVVPTHADRGAGAALKVTF